MENSQFISGIYNWCDRWCERCTFTSRCRVFEKEEIRKNADPNQDVWTAVSDSFKETIELLRKMADEMGINLELSDEEKVEITLKEELMEEITKEHPLKSLADEYLKEGKDWLESSSTKDYLLQLQTQVELGTIGIEDAGKRIKSMEESLEVIQWYLFFIAVKIQRALGDQKGGFWKDYPDEERGDLGTAKIASIAIDRSIGAWGGIYQILPDDDVLLSLLAKLEKMRRLLKDVFPNYPVFIRPGFDEK
jgi:hypothetical protein